MLRKIGKFIKKWWKLSVAMYAIYGFTDVLEADVNIYVDHSIAKNSNDIDTLKELNKRKWYIIPQLIVDNINRIIGHYRRLIDSLS